MYFIINVHGTGGHLDNVTLIINMSYHQLLAASDREFDLDFSSLTLRFLNLSPVPV